VFDYRRTLVVLNRSSQDRIVEIIVFDLAEQSIGELRHETNT